MSCNKVTQSYFKIIVSKQSHASAHNMLITQGPKVDLNMGYLE